MPRNTFLPTKRGPQPRYVPVLIKENSKFVRDNEADMELDEIATGGGMSHGGVYRSAGASQHRKGAPRGDFTGAVQPRHPKVNRKFGQNTRELIGYRYTGLWDNTYDEGVVAPQSHPSFVPTCAALAHAGAPSIVGNIPALRKGPHHYLFNR